MDFVLFVMVQSFNFYSSVILAIFICALLLCQHVLFCLFFIFYKGCEETSQTKLIVKVVMKQKQSQFFHIVFHINYYYYYLFIFFK